MPWAQGTEKLSYSSEDHVLVASYSSPCSLDQMDHLLLLHGITTSLELGVLGGPHPSSHSTHTESSAKNTK